MDNPFSPIKDTVAGGLDLLGTPLDLAGMGAGLISGTASFLAGDGFWNGFTENPFTQTMQDYHQGVTNLTGANDDSIIRRVVGAADMIVGPGVAKSVGKNIARKQIMKKAIAEGNKAMASRAAKDIANNSWKNVLKENMRPANLAKGLGQYAVGDAALGLLTPGESNGTDRAIQGIAALYMGKTGLDAFKHYKGIDSLKDYKTNTDLQKMTPEERRQHLLQQHIDNFRKLDRRQDWFDSKGAALEKMHRARILSNKAITDLNIRAMDIVDQSPIAKDIASEIDRYNKMDIKTATKEQRFATINAELGNRKSRILTMLADEKKLDVKELRQLQDMDMLDAVDYILKKHPEFENFVIGLPTDLDNKHLGLKALKDEMLILGQELGRRYFITPEMRSIFKNTIDRATEAGLITKYRAKELLDNVDNGTYVTMHSDKKMSDKMSVNKESNPFIFERADSFYDEDGNFINIGVDNPGNTIKGMFNKIRFELEAAEQNIIKNRLINTIQDVLPVRKKWFDKEIATLRNSGNISMAKDLEDVRDAICVFHKKENVKNLKPSELEKLSSLHEIEYWVNGEKKTAWISKDWEPIFEIRNPNPSTFNQIVSKVNRVFTSTISGKWNPLFLTKRIMYGLGESVPGIVTEFKKKGIDIGTTDVLKQYFTELREQASSELSKVFVQAMDDETFVGRRLGNNKSELYKWFKDKISEPLDSGHYFMENDIVGDAIRNSNMSVSLNGLVTDIDKIMMSAKMYWNGFNETAGIKILDALKTGVDNAQQNTVLRLIKKNISDPEQQKEMMIAISKKMSDTRRRGAGKTVLGKTFNAIQDYMPYGASSLQGFVGKLEYLPKDILKNSKEYLKKSWNVNDHKLVDTAGDVMMKIGSTLAKLPDSVVFDVLWKTVAIPTAICYIWNNCNNEQSQSYHSLKDYEKANKFILTNFAGPGINIQVPMDQEWSVLKNMFEVMLDSVFGLSKNDEGNPAFSYKNQLAWSIGQDIGISLPVPVEALINMTGYKTNLDPTAPFTDENMIEAINQYKYKRLNPEFATILQSLTGKLGKILVNMAEDKPVMDYRYALPFLQIAPHRDRTNETLSYLNQQLKIRPTPELKSWEWQRRKLREEMQFYLRNGCTKKGEVLGDKTQVLRDYEHQIAELDKNTYIQLS